MADNATGKTPGDIFDEVFNAPETGDRKAVPDSSLDDGAEGEQELDEGRHADEEGGDRDDGQHDDDGADTGDEGGDQGDDDGAGTAQQQDDDAWLDALPEEHRERVLEMRQQAQQATEARTQLERYQRDYAALQGRLAPIQRKLAAYEQGGNAQHQRAEAKPARPAQEPSQPTSEAADPIFGSEKWKKYREEFPEDAETIEAALRGVQESSDQRIQRLEKMIEQQIQPHLQQATSAAEQVYRQEAQARLSQDHPDWQELNQSQEFWAWFEDYRANLPEAIKPQFYDPDSVKQLLSAPENVGFVSNLLSNYKRDLMLVDMPNTNGQQASTQRTNGGGSARTRLATDPQARRSGTAPAARNGARQASDAGELFEQLMNDPNF